MCNDRFGIILLVGTIILAAAAFGIAGYLHSQMLEQKFGAADQASTAKVYVDSTSHTLKAPETIQAKTTELHLKTGGQTVQTLEDKNSLIDLEAMMRPQNPGVLKFADYSHAEPEYLLVISTKGFWVRGVKVEQGPGEAKAVYDGLVKLLQERGLMQQHAPAEEK